MPKPKQEDWIEKFKEKYMRKNPEGEYQNKWYLKDYILPNDMIDFIRKIEAQAQKQASIQALKEIELPKEDPMGKIDVSPRDIDLFNPLALGSMNAKIVIKADAQGSNSMLSQVKEIIKSNIKKYA